MSVGYKNRVKRVRGVHFWIFWEGYLKMICQMLRPVLNLATAKLKYRKGCQDSFIFEMLVLRAQDPKLWHFNIKNIWFEIFFKKLLQSQKKPHILNLGEVSQIKSTDKKMYIFSYKPWRLRAPAGDMMTHTRLNYVSLSLSIYIYIIS